MTFNIDTNFPSVAHLQKRTAQRMPKFAYEYLTEGCNDDINVKKISQIFTGLNSCPAT